MTASRFTIYCHTNRVNGKRYVGQTVYSMEKRWAVHVAAAKSKKLGSPVFAKAILKYGVDAFDHQVLEVVSTLEDANLAETRWVEKLNCRTPHGYNIAVGGMGVGYHHEDTKRLISAASRASAAKTTPEQRSARARWSADRRARASQIKVSESTRAKISKASAATWAKLTPEERSAKTRHQISGISSAQHSERIRKMWANMSPEVQAKRILKIRAASAKSDVVRSEKVRNAWAAMSPEARASRVRKMRSASAKSDVSRSEKTRAWQSEQAKKRTLEQRREIVLKAWVARRAKYGDVGRSKTRETRMVRINLLRAT